MKENILLACLLAVCSASNSFDGFKVFRLIPFSTQQINYLVGLEREEPSLDFWKGASNAGNPVDVMVKPDEQLEFMLKVRNKGIFANVMIDDVQERINSEAVRKNSESDHNWKEYSTLDVIYSWLDQLASENPNVSIISSGKSYEGRDVKGIKVSFKTGNKGVFIEGGIHAREWISPATVTYIIDALLNNNDPVFIKIATTFDWFIFPVVNPDGYAFTHSKNRLWRKTRTPHGKAYKMHCHGADPNRNWASHWGGVGSSNSPCSNIYRGPKVFSEVETSGMAAFLKTVGPTLDVFLSFHSYSQMILIPYSHTRKHLDNYDDIKTIGLAVIASLASKYGTNYTIGNSPEIIYPCSGTSTDWVKQEFKTPVALTYELRDTGKFGFLLPAEQIIPNCEEVMNSIVTLFIEAEKMGYFKLG